MPRHHGLVLVLGVQDVQVVLAEPPELLDGESDGGQGGDEQGEEDADLAVLETPHAAQAQQLHDGEGRRHLKAGRGGGVRRRRASGKRRSAVRPPWGLVRTSRHAAARTGLRLRRTL